MELFEASSRFEAPIFNQTYLKLGSILLSLVISGLLASIEG